MGIAEEDADVQISTPLFCNPPFDYCCPHATLIALCAVKGLCTAKGLCKRVILRKRMWTFKFPLPSFAIPRSLSDRSASGLVPWLLPDLPLHVATSHFHDRPTLRRASACTLR